MSNIVKGLCANCGADEGLHHWKTFQCPAGGVEASVGKKQEWSDRTFEDSNKNLHPVIEENRKLRTENKKLVDLLKRCDKLIPKHFNEDLKAAISSHTK